MRQESAFGTATVPASNYDTDRIWRDDQRHFVHPFTHFDSFKLDGKKTKAALQTLTKRLKLPNALVVDAKENQDLHLAVRNLAKFDVLAPEGLNLESVLRHTNLVLTQSAAKALEGSLS